MTTFQKYQKTNKERLKTGRDPTLGSEYRTKRKAQEAAYMLK